MSASRPAALSLALTALLVVGLAAPVSGATGPYLVKDINGSGASNPSELTVVGDTLFFAAKGPGGRELWKSDGTVAGTVRVKNIRPGGMSSNPRELKNVGGTLYFTANDGVHGHELWRSDGTADGTTMVADIGIDDWLYGPTYITGVDGQLYFFITAPETALWTSDGTTGGTELVEILDPFGATNVYGIYAFDGRAWFQANVDGDNDMDQWVSDGTPEGTHEFEGSGDLLKIGFASVSATLGITTLGVPTEVGGVTYFAGMDATHGIELWKSVDGTLASAQFVADTDPRTDDECGCPVSGFPQSMTAGGNGQLFFTAGYSTFGASENEAGVKLWKSNGTALGTKVVKDISAGVIGAEPLPLTTFKNGVAFTTESHPSPKRLWKSNGKSRGTKPIIPASWRDVDEAYPFGLVNVNGMLVFGAAVGDIFAFDTELWRSDGTPAGTVKLDINPSGSSQPQLLVTVGNAVFFTADDGTHGRELWRYVP